MKKITALMMALVMLLSFAGCQNTQTPTQDTPGNTSSEETSSTAAPTQGSSTEATHESMSGTPQLQQEAACLAAPANPVPPKAAKLNAYGGIEEEENNEGADYKSLEEMYALQEKLYDEISPSLRHFYDITISGLLSNTSGQNLVYSPVNVYLALAMLGEITAGNSRSQILSVLGQESIEDLRKAAASLFISSYCGDNGKTTTTLANSVWLAQNLETKDEVVKLLADEYFASAFRGIMGSDAMNDALKTWLNDNTGHFLEDAVQDVSTYPETIIALASAIYFKAAWCNAFQEEATKTQPFHNASGKDTDCSFLVENTTDVLYAGEHFTAWQKEMEDGNSMIFFLPDEGVSPEELASSEEFLNFLNADPETRGSIAKSVRLHAEVPKFDVSSDLDLSGSLMAMGITDVFSDVTADFSSILVNTDPVEVDSVEHAARVKIDEEGCEAAAFTLIMVKNTSIFMGDTAEFICDRPFIFAVQNRCGATLFTGVVNEVE